MGRGPAGKDDRSAIEKLAAHRDFFNGARARARPFVRSRPNRARTDFDDDFDDDDLD